MGTRMATGKQEGGVVVHDPVQQCVFTLQGKRVILLRAKIQDVKADVAVVPCDPDGLSGGSVYEAVASAVGRSKLHDAVKRLENVASQWDNKEKGKIIRLRPGDTRDAQDVSLPLAQTIILAGRPNAKMEFYNYYSESHVKVVQRLVAQTLRCSISNSCVIPAFGCGKSWSLKDRMAFADGAVQVIDQYATDGRWGVSISELYIAIPDEENWELWKSAFHKVIAMKQTRKNLFAESLSTYVLEPQHHRIAAPPNWLEDQKEVAKGVKRETITYPGARISVLDNFLSTDECKFLTKEAEKAGFMPIDWEYSPEYRTCNRLVVDSAELSHMLWNRLLPLLNRDDIAGARPFGFDNGGVWRPVAVNPCCRFTVYAMGDHFKPHRDGAFVENNEYRSVYTLMVYLNDSDFTGGETKFFEMSPNEVILNTFLVQPKTGRAVIFNHDVWHEGAPVLSGYKYIFRTDVMFHRVDRVDLEHRLRWQKDPELVEAERLYQESIRLQEAGDPAGSTAAYLAALDMQAKLPSIAESAEAPENATYNDDIFLAIFSLLGVKDLLVASAVCKRWHRLARSSSLWLKLYRAKWPMYAAAVQLKIPPSITLPLQKRDEEDVLTDWYSVYKYRVCADENFQCVCIDIQGETTRTAATGLKLCARPQNRDDDNYYSVVRPRRELCDAAFYEMPSVIARYKGHYWMAESGHKHYLVGNEIGGNGYDRFYKPEVPYIRNEDGTAPNVVWHVLEEITSWTVAFAFQELLDSTKHPVLFAAPNWFKPEQVEEMEIRLISNVDIKYYYSKIKVGLGAPYVCVKYAAELALIQAGRKSGIVVEGGDLVSTVVAVYNGKLVPSTLRIIQFGNKDIKERDLSPMDASREFLVEHRLAEEIVNCLRAAPEEMRPVLASEVFPTGQCGHLFGQDLEKAVGKLGERVRVLPHQACELDVILGAQMVASLPNPLEHFKSREDVALLHSLTIRNKQVERDQSRMDPHPLSVSGEDF